ncbi:DEAD/DEAH box helicase [Pengzhenrongella sp.]|jgi:superfamily II DNA or RNA helicase|uniref:DEAD/DEAH box helicase n=1 Tax=Pengzhenrongella sp. TaxID=2888820 RepID=UPI002F956717
MNLIIEDSEIRRVVGGGAYTRGLGYANNGHVLARRWDGKASTLRGTVSGSGGSTYSTSVRMQPTAAGPMRLLDSSCDCPVESGCKHAAALLLHGRTAAAPAGPRPALNRRTTPPTPPAPPAWQRALDIALRSEVAAPPLGRPLGLQFELTAVPAMPGRGTTATYRLTARPVVRSTQGRWIRTGVSWSDVLLGRARSYDTHHTAALGALHALAASSSRGYGAYYPGNASIQLDEIAGRGLWRVLDDIRRAGVSLVLARADRAPANILEAPARALLDVRADKGGLLATPAILVDDEAIAPGHLQLIGGAEPSGAYWWSAADDADPVLQNRRLTLAQFAEPLGAEAAALLRAGRELRVPAEQTTRFWSDYYPRLAARMAVSSGDGSVELPAPPRPVLQVTVQAGEEHSADLEWAWDYRAADGTSTQRVPLWPEPGDRSGRSTDGEARVLAQVTGPGGVLSQVQDATPGESLEASPRKRPVSIGQVLAPRVGASPGADGRLLERCRVSSWQTVDLVSNVLPALRATGDVDVVVIGDLADYRQSEHEPRVTVSADSAPTGAPSDGPAGPVAHDGDWFDLEITVHVGDQEVPLALLLRALALGEDRLLLPDGLWLRIDTPALAGLRTLVEEARALQDSPAGPLRISRFQAGLWAELEALGVVVEQAHSWREAVADLRQLENLPDDVPVPAEVLAELRPYQRAGFAWLTRLWAGGLGGVLADDMGLGKTLQVLALAARLRLTGASADEAGPTRAAPLLVVAPTSVVGNWAVEAARFVPDLRVRTIERTRAKRGTDLAELAADADVVVTSYALFRIEFDDYAALGWSVLVLDEAQMVKNHESLTYSCARQLNARIKVAMTGTPLENTVMELWALLGLVAPGLFPSPRRFTDFYRVPIEREGDAERLALLRRRIRPLMLRRTKEQVAGDLPPRIEHIVEVELAPRHRAVYDRHLHRERQRVLGLLDNFDGNRFEIFRSLMLLRRLSLDPSLVDDAHAGVPATKLDVLDGMLREIVADGHRVLVFSQFTGVLDRVRTRLAARDVAHCYLDGGTTNRPKVIKRFRSGDAPVFLISLKAGGFGLNLTEADYVVVLDPWWNPAVEAQAVDRAHRIGQKRTVMVYRLVATGTIEEKVMALKEGKSRLFESVLGGGDLADARLTAADVRSLLE